MCRARGGQWVIHQAEAQQKSEKGAVLVHPGGDGGEKIACARNTQFPEAEAAEQKAADGWWKTAKNIYKPGRVSQVLPCEGVHLAVTKQETGKDLMTHRRRSRKWFHQHQRPARS